MRTDSLRPRARLRAWVHERAFARRVPLRLERPAFSFTFDDAPLSALETAAPRLESVGARGTFYLAGRATESGGSSISLDGAAALARAGHHVGAHGYAHARLSQQSTRDVYWDAVRCRVSLGEALGSAPEDFAWPYGEIGLGAKRLLARSFHTLRGTFPAAHVGSVDLACLRAVPLYGAGFSRERVRRLVEHCAALRGWLVFYTHGVERAPDAYGTATDDLAWLLELCAAHGDLRTVRHVRRALEPRV
jgi:peptidoglycan/xylan/chitin deacetylase (PgdA/CDA1 family)